MTDEKEKNPAAMELARLAVAKRRLNPEKMRDDSRKGGLIGGKARAASLTPERRKEIAQKASKAAAKARTAKAKAARNAKRAAKQAEKDEPLQNLQ